MSGSRVGVGDLRVIPLFFVGRHRRVMCMSEKAAFRDSLEAEFSDAEFPVKNQMDLVPVLSNGPTTTFEGEDTSITAMEMASKSTTHTDSAPNGGFPYEDIDSMVEDILYGLEKDGVFDE